MRKFGDAYKEKMVKHEQLHEAKVVNEFKQIYNSLLEHYNLTAIHDLNEKSQVAFLTELNQYWTEETGLTDIGRNFLKKRTPILTENSTPLQKKNYLKDKVGILLSETLRQNDIKYKVYNVIDEMYQQVKGKNINSVMSPETINNTITEAFATVLDQFVKDIYIEISESAKKFKSKSVNESIKQKVFIKKKK